MRVISPDNTTHAVTIIPRRYDVVNSVMTVTNEGDKSQSEVTHTLTDDGNYMTLSFELEASEAQKFSYIITDDNGTVYIGRLIATTQEAQEYDPTTKFYIYE